MAKDFRPFLLVNLKYIQIKGLSLLILYLSFCCLLDHVTGWIKSTEIYKKKIEKEFGIRFV